MSTGLNTYSVWSLDSGDDGEEIALVAGEDIPEFADGTPIDKQLSFKFLIQARTFEEAQAIKHLRLGWEPYKPNGAPGECTSCGEVCWPDSFGICWNCGNNSHV